MVRVEKYPENSKFREASHIIKGLVYICFYADRSYAYKNNLLF